MFNTRALEYSRMSSVNIEKNGFAPGIEIVSRVLVRCPEIENITYAVPIPGNSLSRDVIELGKEVVFVDYSQRGLKDFVEYLKSEKKEQKNAHYVRSRVECVSPFFAKPTLFVLPYVTQLDHIDEVRGKYEFGEVYVRYYSFVNSIMKEIPAKSKVLVLNQLDKFLTDTVWESLVKNLGENYDLTLINVKNTDVWHLLVSENPVSQRGWTAEDF